MKLALCEKISCQEFTLAVKLPLGKGSKLDLEIQRRDPSTTMMTTQSEDVGIARAN